MKLPIADCQLPIAKLATRDGFARGGHDGGEVVGFLQKSGELAFWNDSGFDQQFKPQSSFVGFFLNCPDFCCEFCFAPSAAGRTVVRSYGSSAANDLFCDDTPRIIRLGDGSRQLNDPKRKRFGSLFQFGGIHAPKLQKQSPLADRQSPIIV
jgi:hypothetical protein